VLIRSRILWLCLFLIPIAWQLWVPPIIGLADNGDFAKVVGRYGLSPAEPGPQPKFHFFHRLWRSEASAVWESPYWGIEVWLTRAALWISQERPFDIRWLGLIHTGIIAGAFWLMVSRKIAPNLFVLLAFTDAAYVSYFQSFHFDAASIVFILLLFAAWKAEQPWVLALAGIGFALAKAPHAPLALMLGLLLLLERKRSFVPGAMLLLVGGGYMLSQTKDEYKATAYYNLAFFKLGLIDVGALDALKIRTEDRRLMGTHAFMPESPAQNENWLKGFYPKGGYGNALLYYASHPGVAAQVLWTDLSTEAPQIRAINLGNYERNTGKAYCTLSTTFGWYSAAKSWLFRVAPWHVFLLLALALWKVGKQPLTWAVVAMGSYEFAIASLADACETYRHLLLFHVAYDLLIWLSLISIFDTQSKRVSSV